MQTIRVNAGQQADLWSGVNVKGHVYYLVRTRDGSDCATMWWVKWGTGSVEQIGKRCGVGRIDVPSGLLDLSYRLRCSVVTDTVIYVSDDVAVDHNLSFKWG